MILYKGRAIICSHKCTNKKLEIRGYTLSVNSHPLNIRKFSYILHKIHMIAVHKGRNCTATNMHSQESRWSVMLGGELIGIKKYYWGATQYFLSPCLLHHWPGLFPEWWICCSRESNQWMQTSQAVEHYDLHICMTRSSIMRSGLPPYI